jgi:hypothetical protein
MKQKALDTLKREAIEAAEAQYPEGTRYDPVWIGGKMMVTVYDHEGRGQLRDVGVTAK